MTMPGHAKQGRDDAATDRRRSFHHGLPGFAPTPLHASSALAAFIGVESVLIKDERSRLGLPSFKILGASWATIRSLEALGLDAGATFEEIREFVGGHALVFVTATDGNHGRAVAHIARIFGGDSVIVLPSAISSARADSIRQEGASVLRVAGSYEDAVESAQILTRLSANAVLVADTSTDANTGPGDWVIEGYATIYEEIEGQLAEYSAEVDDDTIVAIPAGVGALAAAGVRYASRSPLLRNARLITVEPRSAACVKAAVERGEPVRLHNDHSSVMATLNAGHVSSAAWPDLKHGLEAAVAVSDDDLIEALRTLALDGLDCGESGAASVAGARAYIARLPEARRPRRLIALMTEGVTDPDLHRRLLGDVAPSRGRT
jgi:diaminopropionate ammonia-lyase